MRLPCHFSDKANLQTGLRTGAAKGIDHKQAFASELVGNQLPQFTPGFGIDGVIVVFTLV